MLTHETESRRQRDVAYMIAQGKTKRQIAAILGLSVATVQFLAAMAFHRPLSVKQAA